MENIDVQGTMTYKDLIKQWFERAEVGNDPFTKFIFLYISFIAFLSQQSFDTSDRKRVERVKNNENAMEYYKRLVRSDSTLRGSISDLVRELENQPIVNSTRDNDTHWEGTDGVLSGVEDWKNLVEFWYRVRNNLFHGHKAPEFERDRVLVSYACSTLIPFMRNFIEHDLDWIFD